MTLRALVQPLDSTTHRILAPAVGLFHSAVALGYWLPGGAPLGTLQVLTTRHELVLPPTIHGRVHTAPANLRLQPVQYGEELFRLVAAAQPPEIIDAGTTVIAASGAVEADETADGVLIRASTTGTFYRRPTPKDPPFVDLGARLERGRTLGLIEVMKVFNQVRYDLDQPGELVRILAEDGKDVQPGTPLFRVKLM